MATKIRVSQQCVVGVYKTFDEARYAIDSLEAAKYPPAQVSLVTHNVREEAPVEELQYGDKAEANATRGAGLGGLVGALLGAPLLTIPGLGVVVAAGPIGTALAGAIVGGLLGGFSGWGIHEDHAREYEVHVQQGDWLVVADGDPGEVAAAQAILEATNAERVDLHARNSSDSPEIDDRP